MQRSYHDVQSLISPDMFRSMGGISSATDVDSHRSVVHEAVVTADVRGRYEAAGHAEDQYGYTSRVEQPYAFRTPLRAKVAAIHAARDAVRRLGYSN